VLRWRGDSRHQLADGTILKQLSIEELGIVWSIDKAEMKSRVEEALMGLNSAPNYFADRIAKLHQPIT